MRKLLPMFAIFGVAASPAIAQEAPAPAASIPAPAPAPQVKMVTKVVCQRVEVEATSGSRLTSPPKICKKVTVPANGSEAKNDGPGTKAPQGR